MKRIVLTLATLLITSIVFAQWRTAESALQVANKSVLSAPSKSVKTQGTSLKKAYTLYSKDRKHSLLYGFNRQGGGFVLVSGSEYTPEILGYADKGTFPSRLEDMPDGLRYLMQVYQAQIEEAATTRSSAPKKAAAKTAIEPLLTTKWTQSSPYNNDCNGNLVGCVAVVMGQIMKFHKCPATATGTHGEIDFSSHTWDYDLMLDSYDGSYTTDQSAEVAKLLHWAGVSVDMQYGTSASSAYTTDMVKSLNTYWGFDDGMYMASRQNYSDAQWTALIYNELEAGRPVPYNGNDGESGHAFIVDGYKDGQFHLNWGWGGYCDGYFMINSLVPEQTNPKAYKYGQQATINAKPEDNVEATAYLEAADSWTLSGAIVTSGSSLTVNASASNVSLKTFSGKLGVIVTDMETNQTQTVYGATTISGLQPFYSTSFSITIPTTDLTSGHSYTLTPVYLADGSSEPVTLNMLNTQPTLTFKIDASDTSKELYPRRMVVEEGTGTWCQYCPRGIVGMEYMREQYPDNFIGIAIHNGDAMGYTEGYGLTFDSYPNAFFNRSYYTSPEKETMESYLKNTSGLTTDAMVKVQTATYSDDFSEMTVTANTRFGFDATETDYRLAYVITEDNVGPYMQSNAYAGGENGEMGGFESKSNPCEVTFNDVARGIYPSNTGVEGSVPPTIEACTDYSHEYTFSMPASVENYSNLQLTALLYNAKTGEIVNADRIACPEGKKLLEITVDTGEEPGTLATKLGDQIYDISSLTVKGQINGEDLATLRTMMGLTKIMWTAGEHKNLKILDLQDADIVKGGVYLTDNYNSVTWTLEEDNVLPSSVFYDNSFISLKKITTPKTLKKVDDYALASSNNGSLEEVVLNEGLESIGREAFSSGGYYDTPPLKSLHIPSTVKSIDGTFIQGCASLDDFSITENNPYYTFDGQAIYTYNKKQLVCAFPPYKGILTTDENCTRVGDSGLEWTGYLTGLVGKNVRNIGSQGFNYALSMQFMALGAGLNTINSAFDRCNSLTAIYLGCSKVPDGAYTETSNWLEISNCTLYVPQSAINDFRASSFWSQLKDIKPIEETEYGYLVNCGKMDTSVSIDLGDNPGTLEERLGEDIWDVEVLKLSGKVNGADLLCLRRMAGADSTFTVSHTTGLLSELDMTEAEFVVDNSNSYYNGWTIEEANSIPRYAFGNCRNLISFKCPEKTFRIGDSAFAGCFNMNKIELNSSLQEIFSGAFDHTGISEIALPEGLTLIGDVVFENTKLTSLYIPGSVTSLGSIASYCENLNDITFGSGSPYIFKDGVVYTNDFKSLITCLNKYKGSLIVDSRCTTIYSRAFQGCSNMTTFVAPNVQSVQSYSFWSCTNLNTLYFGSNIKQISNYVFNSGTSLSALCINNLTPPEIEADEWFFMYNWKPADNFALYVPAAAVEDYKAHAVWSKFGDIKAIEGTILENLDKQQEFASYPRRTVIEEGAATWCAWCVRGLVAMDKLKQDYADYFIPIAIHSDDEMSGAENYSLAFSGYPDSYINRNTDEEVDVYEAIWRSQIESAGTKATSMVKLNKVSLSEDEKSINISAEAKFGEPKVGSDYRIAYVITEDGVGPYTQNNSAYSGGANGEMGGYENEPTQVSMTFDDVARGIYPSLTGVEGIIPTDIAPGSEYTHNYTITLPSNIDNLDNVKVTALLYNYNTGEIENADRCAIGYDSSLAEALAFVDEEGNTIVDGSTIEMNNLTSSDFGDYIPLEGLSIKNVSDGDIKCRITATIDDLPAGSFQCCVGTSCYRLTKAGTITISGIDIAADASKVFSDTEWYIEEGTYGTLNVKFTLEASSDGNTYVKATSVNVNFVYSNSILLGDVNNDTKIDVTDIAYLVAFLNDKIPVDFIESAADVDGNGVVNVDDVTALSNLVIKKQ